MLESGRSAKVAHPTATLTARASERQLDELVAQNAAQVGVAKTDTRATLADLVPQYLDFARHTQRIKPSTLREYSRLLAAPGPDSDSEVSTSHASRASSATVR